MKRLILTIAGLAAVVGLCIYARPRVAKETSTETVAPSERPGPLPSRGPAAKAQKVQIAPKSPEASVEETRSLSTSSAAPFLPPEQIFQQNLDILISPQSTFDQKQAAWKIFKDPFKLDQLVAALEERLAADPQIPEYS